MPCCQRNFKLPSSFLNLKLKELSSEANSTVVVMLAFQHNPSNFLSAIALILPSQCQALGHLIQKKRNDMAENSSCCTTIKRNPAASKQWKILFDSFIHAFELYVCLSIVTQSTLFGVLFAIFWPGWATTTGRLLGINGKYA